MGEIKGGGEVTELAVYPRLIQSLLSSRGVRTADEAERFLRPDFVRDIHDPFLFRQMRVACERLWQAIEENEKIAVHGDYDADGICGSVLMTDVLRFLCEARGRDWREMIVNYHPHREHDGYGIRVGTIDRFAEQGVSLMITVDCGISCADEIAHATTKGIDTIVVDHHEFDPEKLPKCILLHPRLPEEVYPFKYLAAVGVAFKFACGMLQFVREKGVSVPEGYEKWLMDLVSIATVTDVMPLVGENRVLEKFGLKVLNKTRRVGLRALIDVSGLKYGAMDTTSVGFAIGPRINAASRMDHANAAVETLLAMDESTAAVAAERLQELNKARQKYTQEVYAAAYAMALEQADKKALVVKGLGWLAGIVGLVAGKLLNEFGKPVFVFGDDGERMVGSGRAVGFNVVTAMERAKEYLARFGGHPQACGLTIIGEENYTAFAESVWQYAEEVFGDAMPESTVELDGEVGLGEVTLELVEMLDALAPFGEGNREPKLLLRNVEVSGVVPVGKNGSHVQVYVRNSVTGEELKMIGFYLAAKMKDYVIGTRVDVVVELGVNEWQGRRTAQAKIVDVALTGAMIQKTAMVAV
jgi:single-stranded-DNA-specific exonuclease